MSDFKPFIKKIDDIDDIFESETDIIESKYQNLPLITLGFNSFIKQVREKMLDKQLKERLFYLVVNNFEHKINDHNDDLENISIKLFKDSGDKNFERSFFKLWEMIVYFDLINLNDKDFLSSHLCEKDGSFLKATLEYRNKYLKKDDVKKDHYCVTTKPNNKKLSDIQSECMNKYKSSIFKYEKSNTDLNDETGNDGGLTNTNNIKEYIKVINKNKKLASLITCNGDFNNVNEVDMYKLILGQIITSISSQKKGGNMVLKIFDTYTLPTLKMICILKSLYNEVFVCKPLMSRNFKEEKFLVCKGFKFDQDSKLKNKIDNLYKLLDDVNNSQNIYDIFSNYILSNKLKQKIIDINLNLSNNQYISINNIIEYKNSGNYFGDSYHKYKDNQIEATKWWVDTFYVSDSKKLSETQKLFKKLIV